MISTNNSDDKIISLYTQNSVLRIQNVSYLWTESEVGFSLFQKPILGLEGVNQRYSEETFKDLSSILGFATSFTIQVEPGVSNSLEYFKHG